MTQISVDQGKWDAVPEEERRRIQAGLVQSGLLREGDVLAPGAALSDQDLQWDPIKDICKAACDVAAASAVAWCTANTGGAATALCIAAAESARQECRRRC
jgi:hypothetical protein